MQGLLNIINSAITAIYLLFQKAAGLSKCNVYRSEILYCCLLQISFGF